MLPDGDSQCQCWGGPHDALCRQQQARQPHTVRTFRHNLGPGGIPCNTGSHLQCVTATLEVQPRHQQFRTGLHTEHELREQAGAVRTGHQHGVRQQLNRGGLGGHQHVLHRRSWQPLECAIGLDR